MIENKHQTTSESSLAGIIERNIYALLDRRKQEEASRETENKFADAIARFTGRMVFVYIHLVVFSLWIFINVGWIPLPRFDPSLVILAMAASVEAFFLSTFVLISQNRMAEVADKRADLDLQISLLSEHEITRLIQLVQKIAEKMKIEESMNPELNELAKDIKPEEVLDTMEAKQKNISKDKK